MKKAFFMCLLLVIILISGLSIASAAYNSDFNVGDKFLEQNAERYWGPYGPAFTLVGGALVFDSTVPDGWVTLNFKDDELPPDAYQYVILTVKADNPEDAQGAILTFGNVKKSFSDWGIKLSNTYAAYVLELKPNGFTAWGDGRKAIPDFALNTVPNKKFTIYVDKIKLTNKPPVTDASSSPKP
jgi:hypothetical protein